MPQVKVSPTAAKAIMLPRAIPLKSSWGISIPSQLAINTDCFLKVQRIGKNASQEFIPTNTA
jgi:hypothetical protein